MPDYSTIMNLPYLDMVLHETLRMHPALSHLERHCTKDYKIPGSDVVIKAGEDVQINVIGIHTDEQYFPNPGQFNPENFSKKSKASRSP